uniref:Uncharacterized protein n=1 Tax=Odontella aurita TaxID=265563 RepID=A0A7S4K4P5_9STRA|mmetsp:Transcript_609/g.1864  ORF Transcript_609/g.1864 Transcript_609/m.1864 type:complete len:411 (+) Transcript_609:355-1587(+)
MDLKQNLASVSANMIHPHGRTLKEVKTQKRKRQQNEPNIRRHVDKIDGIGVTGGDQNSNLLNDWDKLHDDVGSKGRSVEEGTKTSRKSRKHFDNEQNVTKVDSVDLQPQEDQQERGQDLPVQEKVEGTITLSFSILFDGGIVPLAGDSNSVDGTQSTNPILNAGNLQSDQELRDSVLDAVVWALCEEGDELDFIVIGGPCGDSWQANDIISVSILAPYSSHGMFVSLRDGYSEMYRSSSVEFPKGFILCWTEWDVALPVIHLAELEHRTGSSMMKTISSDTQNIKPNLTDSSPRADAKSAALWGVKRSANSALRSQIERGAFDTILRKSNERVWASSPTNLEEDFFSRFLLSTVLKQADLRGNRQYASSKSRDIFGMHPALLAVAVLTLLLGLLVAYKVMNPRRKSKLLP